MNWADQYLELRAAVLAGDVPRGVGKWAIEELVALAPHYQRASVRDRFLVAASRHMSGGSDWARAAEIRSELLNLDRHAEPGTPARALIAEARRIDPGLPHSIRGLFRVLRGADPTDNVPVALSEQAAVGFLCDSHQGDSNE